MSIHHRLTTLGFTPLADETGTVTHWCVSYPNGLTPDGFTNQTITNELATAVLSHPEVGEYGLGGLRTFWRLLGWHRVDGGFRRGSWFLPTEKARAQFDAALEVANK